MPGLKLKVTDAGRAALVNATNTGTNTVRVAQVSIANAPFAVSAALTALPNEIKRINAVGGTITAADTIHVSIRDESTAVYDCYGFGMHLADGTLFAVYSQPDLLLGKAAAAMMLLALDAVFTDIDVAQLTFGDTNFTDPAATTEVPGIVELATETEATAGADKVRAITAYLLKKVLDARLGAGAPSDFVKGLLGLATAALLRGALELKGAALKDEGAGNGLDADKLDGKHASEFASTVHGHAISDIAGLTAALNATWNTGNFDPSSKFDKTGGAISGPVKVNLGDLGTAAGATLTTLSQSGSTSNVDYLEQQLVRKTAGTDWSTAAWRIGRRVDVTSQGYVEFSGAASDRLLSFGGGATEWGYLTNLGAWIFNSSVTVSGSLGVNSSVWIKGYYYATGASEVGIQLEPTSGRKVRFTSNSSPNIGIYDVTNSAWLLRIASDNTAYFSGQVMPAGGFQPQSSRDLKTAFRENPYGLDAVLQLETTLGKYRKWVNADGLERVFLISENIAQVIPPAAKGPGFQLKAPGARRARRYGGYSMEQMLAVYAKAFQDLHAIVVRQGERITELEKSA